MSEKRKYVITFTGPVGADRDWYVFEGTLEEAIADATARLFSN
jgi:hypothetical protein